MRSKNFRVTIGVIAVLAVGAPLSLVALLRIFSRNRDTLLSNGTFRTFLKRYNQLTRWSSGTPLSAHGLLSHLGRRSGRGYQTSLGVTEYGDGFLVPLTYGPRTDWYRNLDAAQGGTLAWKGRSYPIERPEIVSGFAPIHAWPLPSRIMLQLAGVHDFAWLHHREENLAVESSQIEM